MCENKRLRLIIESLVRLMNVTYSAMYKKRYKFSFHYFYAQKWLIKLFSLRNLKSWKKLSNWHQSQSFWPIQSESIIDWKPGIVNICVIYKWLLKLSLIKFNWFLTNENPWDFELSFIWVVSGICSSIGLGVILIQVKTFLLWEQ